MDQVEPVLHAVRKIGADAEDIVQSGRGSPEAGSEIKGVVADSADLLCLGQNSGIFPELFLGAELIGDIEDDGIQAFSTADYDRGRVNAYIADFA
jgi:hypothetical protein